MRPYCRGLFGVECDGCGVRGLIKDTEAEATKVWNTRAERTCVNDSERGFHCSACKFGDFDGFHGYEPNFCPNCGAKVVG